MQLYVLSTTFFYAISISKHFLKVDLSDGYPLCMNTSLRNMTVKLGKSLSKKCKVSSLLSIV